MDNKEILLIHLGGLGDMCLSESTFFSLSEHFREGIVALGYTRFLSLFKGYFKGTERIESAKWLPLFSQSTSDMKWQRIIFIGSDREGALREKWGKISKEQMIFIRMYPERSAINCHVEDFQLLQLGQYGIEAVKKETEANLTRRVILYPEKGFKKKKWGYENFLRLYNSLRDKGVNVYILASIGLEKDVKGAVFFEELADVCDYFREGGIFVSNDSGMAHLAGMCGLYTVTIFNDFDPAVWHPRGHGTCLKSGKDSIDVPSIESRIMEAIKKTNVFYCNSRSFSEK